MWANKIDEEISIREVKDQLQAMVNECRQCSSDGKVATYIPELGKADPAHFAVSLCLTTGEIIEAGDVQQLFTLQSVSKVITLALALMDVGEKVVFNKVGMEPTGDPFNSIVKLETMQPNKPLNPMINAGALAVTSLIIGNSVEQKLGRLLQFVHEWSGNAKITYNEQVALSEWETAHLNRALIYFMKAHGVITDLEEVLQVYVHQCALEMRCRDIAKIGAVLAANGQDQQTGKQVIPAHIAKICKVFMVTCGMYNASGEFAIRVGIPAKSGVSGAILGAIPHQLGLGIFSPALDDKGNSIAGLRLLESLSKRWRLSIF